MLQTAAFAQALGANNDVVVAALLHDIGYFLSVESANQIALGRNTEHEALGAAWLSRGYGESITAPIALHVQAKRYLCAADPNYHAQLSEASRHSLVVQGGAMNAVEIAAFANSPAFEAAILLRRCDDRGKDPSMTTAPLESFRSLLTDSLFRYK
jgi:gamma-butyrobetaine dioxygenase